MYRENDFTELHTLKLFVGTWNVNGKKPADNIEPWLFGDNKSSGTPTVSYIASPFIINIISTDINTLTYCRMTCTSYASRKWWT